MISNVHKKGSPELEILNNQHPDTLMRLTVLPGTGEMETPANGAKKQLPHCSSSILYT